MKFLVLLAFAFAAAPAYGRRHEMAGDDVMYAAGSAVECDLCEMFVGDLKKVLETKEDEIIDAADKLCAKKPIIFGTNCSALVNEVISVLFQVVDVLTANEICQELQLCDAAEELAPPRRSQRTFVRMVKYIMQKTALRNQVQKKRMIRRLRRTVGEDYQCEFCKDTIGFLHDAITCNETWGEIVGLLVPTCKYCPIPAECQKFWEGLPAEVKALADEYLDSTEDCTMLGFCTSSDEGTDELDALWMWEGFWSAEDESEEDETLEEEEEELLELVEETENLEDEVLEEQLKMKKKKAYWRAYKNKVAANQWLKAKKAGTLRQPRRLRRSSTNVIELVLSDTFDEEDAVPYAVDNYMQLPEDVTCDLCEGIARIGDEWLDHHEDEFYNTFTTNFADLCEKLPGSWRAACNEDIAQELPLILFEMLRNIMQPRTLCEEMLDVCPVDQLEEL